MQTKLKRINYQKPELIEISLLDESAMGDSLGDEPGGPPGPAPPGGTPPFDPTREGDNDRTWVPTGM